MSMNFQFLSILDPSSLPHPEIWSTVGTNSYIVSITDETSSKITEKVIDIITGSDDFEFSDSFSQSLAHSWGYVLKKEDPSGFTVPGTTQLMTWINGYTQTGQYKGNIENKKQKIGIYKDAAALAPLNLTPYRLWDILNGWGIDKQDRVVFFSCLTALKSGTEVSTSIVNSPTNNLQVAALASIGFPITDSESYKAKWVGYSRSAFSERGWPLGSYVTGVHPTIGEWRLSLDNLRVNDLSLVSPTFASSIIQAGGRDALNWVSNKGSVLTDGFKNSISVIKALDD